MLKKVSWLLIICCMLFTSESWSLEQQAAKAESQKSEVSKSVSEKADFQTEQEKALSKEEANKTEAQQLKEKFKGSHAKINIVNSGVYISDFNFKELEYLFEYLEYDEYIKLPGGVYPRIFVKNIPYDFAAMPSATERNRVFIKILMPLVLKVNQEVAAERENLLSIKEGFKEEKDFHPIETIYLEKLAKKYDVNTPFKDTRRYMYILDELVKRVDIVPPSLLIASAAIHTNWGTSRIAIQGHNLYKAREWYTDDGLKPIGETDDSYRYKIYPNLEEAIREYVLKVNSNINYAQLWSLRQIARKRHTILYGKSLDWTFVTDSNLTNYAGLLDYTLTYYKFFYLDEGTLEEEYEFDR